MLFIQTNNAQLESFGVMKVHLGKFSVARGRYAEYKTMLRKHSITNLNYKT